VSTIHEDQVTHGVGVVLDVLWERLGGVAPHELESFAIRASGVVSCKYVELVIVNLKGHDLGEE